ncbi:MAG: SDR family oxidoreductase [Chloroflexi bacterium]|nr:SDR family oxidoreductase [Chloroflexota bacterium]
MKILILGGTGMLGHQLMMQFSDAFETWATVRGSASTFPDLPGIDRQRILGGVEATHYESLIEAFAAARPDLVINCIGLIKQRENAGDALAAIDLNARFPHQVALLCRACAARMIHISTDCVFSGQKGQYTEEEPTDARDVYGKTKALGEIVDQPHCLTLRTSLIGRELTTRYSLLEWFLAQRGSVKGFQRAIFSGLPTMIVAQMIRDYIIPNPELTGLYHVAAEPINKYDLLVLFRDAFEHTIEIIPDERVIIDRSLNGERFRAATGFVAPNWPEMVAQMPDKSVPYELWKKSDYATA